MDILTPGTHTKTIENLMRAFAGESQARNRYEIAAKQAKNQKLPVIEAIFKFTANQEKEHAEVFYKHLRSLAGKNVNIEGGYPVDLDDDVSKLLRFAQRNEYEEHDDVYRHFSEQAKEEGLAKISTTFSLIAEVEKIHGDRFGRFAEYLEQNQLFVSGIETGWMCLNCGYVYTGKEAPKRCPACDHEQGYFIRLELAPYIA